VLASLLAGCTADEGTGPAAGEAPGSTTSPPPGDREPSPRASSTPPTASSPPAQSRAPAPEATESATEAPDGPARFRARPAMATVRRLAGRIGPREATSPAFHRAARFVDRRLAALGYDVERQRFGVPAGDSWGVPVDAGPSVNVVGSPDGFRPARPHLLVGAHLDTVAQAPGAEDNASGVAVMLELARLAAQGRTRWPVVFVAFGAEEPRGEGDALHHFGSREYVRRMGQRERRGLRAMVSLDRVGVGTVVPVCTGGLSPLTVRSQLVRAARAVDAPVQTCADNASSDHWQFEQAGEVVARLGSTPYAAYHSEADVPAVVSRAQLRRVGRIAWEWLQG
jgi:aminopeptidase YwaD